MNNHNLLPMARSAIVSFLVIYGACGAGEEEPMPASSGPFSLEIVEFATSNLREQEKNFDRVLKRVTDRLENEASVRSSTLGTMMVAARNIDQMFHKDDSAPRQSPTVARYVDTVVPYLKRQPRFTSQPYQIARLLMNKAYMATSDLDEQRIILEQALRELAPYRDELEILRLEMASNAANNAAHLAGIKRQNMIQSGALVTDIPEEFDIADNNYRMVVYYPWNLLDSREAKERAQHLAREAAESWIRLRTNNPKLLDAIVLPPFLALSLDPNLQNARREAGLPPKSGLGIPPANEPVIPDTPPYTPRRFENPPGWREPDPPFPPIVYIGPLPFTPTSPQRSGNPPDFTPPPSPQPEPPIAYIGPDLPSPAGPRPAADPSEATQDGEAPPAPDTAGQPDPTPVTAPPSP